MNVLDPKPDTHIRFPSAECALARHVQPSWAAESIEHRLQFVRQLRHELAAGALELATAAAAVAGRPVAEKLISEVLPLADACRWLERSAAPVLADQFHGRRRRPFWLQGASFRVIRQPFGLILVIGPANYPLFLPAVHALHALVAGNAVLLKPAPGTRAVIQLFARLVRACGLDPRLLTILPEEVEAGRACIPYVDKVVFTGSSGNGRSVLEDLAPHNTPAVMELSGADPVVVLHDAELDLAVQAIRFGADWNGGDTCIAPRRLLAHVSVMRQLRAKLLQAGLAHFVVEDFQEEADAVQLIYNQDYALGVSIFSGDENRAAALAKKMQTGFVTINDLIVPTADPRMPFGGMRKSGFGVTRGAAGLLEMTHPQVVSVRKGKARAHFQPLVDSDAELFTSYITAAHAEKFGHRWRAVRRLVQLLVSRRKGTK